MGFRGTSYFSNELNSSDRHDQRKALLKTLKMFDGLSDNVLQYQADFAQRMEECGVQSDFNYVISENQPPTGIDLSDPKTKAAWLSNAKRFQSGNLFRNPSSAT